VIANGFLMGEALDTVAGRFPNTSFAIIDFPWAALKGKPMNARGLVFVEREAGYLAGVSAATASKSSTVGAVGGQAVPAVVGFLAGYRAGAKANKPSLKVLSGYSQDFVDQAKCKELALNQLSRGSDVVLAAAGGCGLGALQAAKERSAWGIGVDGDQSSRRRSRTWPTTRSRAAGTRSST
jgi:basic membrane protein A and related proteins